MVKKRKPYQTFTKEFKLEAIRLMETSQRPPSEIAMELGIRRNQLYKWKDQLAEHGDAAFKAKGRPRKEDQSELTLLQQENARLKTEVEILKKAAAYFARELT
jgi:transposase